MFRTTALIVALGVTPAFVATTATPVSADQTIVFGEEDKQVEYTSGTVTNIDADDHTFTIETASGAENRITYGDDTAFMHGGDDHDAEDVLQYNKRVYIEHREGLASLVFLAPEDDSEAEIERDWGTVTNIDADDDTFTIELADGEAKQVTFGDDTVFMKDGEVCPMDDLIDYDMNVRVLHREGLAWYVIADETDHDRDDDRDE